MIPGCSRNWRRTSWTTVPAERPTARMASAEKRKAIEPPMSTPMKIGRVGDVDRGLGQVEQPVDRCDRGGWRLSWEPIVSMKEAKSATEARTAEPMATPLVTALVVLPTASRLTMTRSASPVNSPDISATPAALSETGPKLSSETIIPAVDSRPIPVEGDQVEGELDVPAASPIDTEMASTMAMIAHTDDSSPREMPARVGWRDRSGPIRRFL